MTGKAKKPRLPRIYTDKKTGKRFIKFNKKKIYLAPSRKTITVEFMKWVRSKYGKKKAKKQVKGKPVKKGIVELARKLPENAKPEDRQALDSVTNAIRAQQ